jgi:hypothetical protein
VWRLPAHRTSRDRLGSQLPSSAGLKPNKKCPGVESRDIAPQAMVRHISAHGPCVPSTGRVDGAYIVGTASQPAPRRHRACLRGVFVSSALFWLAMLVHVRGMERSSRGSPGRRAQTGVPDCSRTCRGPCPAPVSSDPACLICILGTPSRLFIFILRHRNQFSPCLSWQGSE